jgi:hypothetical protein
MGVLFTFIFIAGLLLPSSPGACNAEEPFSSPSTPTFTGKNGPFTGRKYVYSLYHKSNTLINTGAGTLLKVQGCRFSSFGCSSNEPNFIRGSKNTCRELKEKEQVYREQRCRIHEIDENMLGVSWEGKTVHESMTKNRSSWYRNNLRGIIVQGKLSWVQTSREKTYRLFIN